MKQPSNTPPNGDFARYIERLTGANAGQDKREDFFQSGDDAQAGEPFVQGSGTPSAHGVPKPVAGMNFLKHAKWVAVAWIATQVLAKLVPGAGFFFIPLLIAYAVWVVFKLNLNSSGDLRKHLRELALNAIEDVKKSQHSPKK